MRNDRREFNKLLALSASLLPVTNASSTTTAKPSKKGKAIGTWETVSSLAPRQYLAERAKSAKAFKTQIQEQFIDGETARLGGVTISYIELATLAVLDEI